MCPYKGVATWWSLEDGPADVAWGRRAAARGLGLADHLASTGDDVTVEVDGTA